MISVFKEFQFEASHWLPNVPFGHKCGRMHGHSYRVRVEATGTVGLSTGWVMDFGEISRAMQPLVEQLDHNTVNSVVSNPTCENLCQWFVDSLTSLRGALSRVEVWETATSGCAITL